MDVAAKVFDTIGQVGFEVVNYPLIVKGVRPGAWLFSSSGSMDTSVEAGPHSEEIDQPLDVTTLVVPSPAPVFVISMSNVMDPIS